jgi:4-carboxymuconolactone decarboxylase
MSEETRPGVPLRPADDAPLRELEVRGIAVSELYRALANHPPALRAWTDMAWTLRGLETTSRMLRELLILRAAQLSGARYVWRDHVPMAKAAGVPDGWIAELDSWRESELFDHRTAAALAVADELIEFGVVQEEQLAELERLFAPAQVIELSMTVAFYAMVPRVLNALRVPLEGDSTVG